jgi:DNA-binding NtrC family response regulator
MIFSQDKFLCKTLTSLLTRNSYDVTSFYDSVKAIDAIREEPFDLVFIDFPHDNKLNHELVTSIHCFHDLLPIIVITDSKKIDIAKEAVKNGATTYVTRPLNSEALLLTLKIALHHAAIIVENLLYRRDFQKDKKIESIPKASDCMLQIYSLAEKLAQTDLAVLIRGETGTGKETLAHRIHLESPRNYCSFCKVDCSDLPEKMQEKELFGYFRPDNDNKHVPGVFEKNNGGTLFLDNIESLPLNTQVKLLYFLQKGKIQLIGSNKIVNLDVRLITGSAAKLEVIVSNNSFCANLYEKLQLATIELPPLRKRRKDIPELVENFLKIFSDRNCRPVTISSQALATLCEYNWPGNIEQLKKLIERLVCTNETGKISNEELPPELFKETEDELELIKIEDEKLDDIMPLKKYLQIQERLYMEKVLEHSGGDKNLAAKKLDISLASFYRKLQEGML